MENKKSLGLVERAKRRGKAEGLHRLATRTINRIDVQTHLFLAKHMMAVPKLTYGAIEITNACNLHCGMCEVERKRRSGLEHIRFISLDFCKKIIDQFAEMHTEVTLNYGGESLLHPKFREIVTYAIEAKERGLGKVSWFDNAMLFSEEISRLVVDLGVDQLTFSVDRLGVANNDWRCGSEINLIENNISNLMKIRGAKKKPYVMVNKVDVDSREHTIAFIKHWLGIVDEVQVSTYRKPIWKVSDPEKYFIYPEIYHPRHCPFPFYFMGVLADGRVSGCGCDASAENQMGNAFKDTLKDIWVSDCFKAFRKNTLNHVTFDSSPCSICDCWTRRFKPCVARVEENIEVVYGESKNYRLVHNVKGGETKI